MLVLTRKLEQSLMIGGSIEIKVLEVRGTGAGASVRLGIVAPPHVSIYREEVFREMAEENHSAARLSPSVDIDSLIHRLSGNTGDV